MKNSERIEKLEKEVKEITKIIDKLIVVIGRGVDNHNNLIDELNK